MTRVRAGSPVEADKDRGSVNGTVKSASRVLSVLELLTGEPAGLTFSEICKALTLPKSSAYLLLRTMTDRGHLSYEDERRRYRIGVRIWQAGCTYLDAIDLVKVAQPVLVETRDALKETVQLAILDGAENVYLAKEDGDQHVVVQSRVGARLPAYATGLGKVLLSGLSDREVTAVFGRGRLVGFTPHTITDVRSLLEELAAVRTRGYAIDRGEYTDGVVCLAVPVRNHVGATIAALSVSVPEQRSGGDFFERAKGALGAAGERLSLALGYGEALRVSAVAES